MLKEKIHFARCWDQVSLFQLIIVFKNRKQSLAIQHYTRELKTWLSFTVSTKSHLCAAMLGKKLSLFTTFLLLTWSKNGVIQAKFKFSVQCIRIMAYQSWNWLWSSVSRDFQTAFSHSTLSSKKILWSSRVVGQGQVGEDGRTVCKTDKSKAAQDGCVMNVYACDLRATKFKSATGQPPLVIFKYMLY